MDFFDIWTFVLFVHILGAIVWVGGQLTLTLVVTPVARELLPEEQRAVVMRTAGKRYAFVTNAIALPLQLATGLALTFHWGVDSNKFEVDGWGELLGAKLLVVLVSIGFAGAHGVMAAKRNSVASRNFALAGLAASVLVVLLAAGLAS
ncbi:MAG: hypothetical protein MUF83_00430 [Acidimicrobiales bacterium]|jgi:uncharacterized membrane protein|nr:hypothetical protein [Acidimicrobiales bacterium]